MKNLQLSLLYFTDADADALTEYAEACGVSVTDYVWALLFTHIHDDMEGIVDPE